MNPATRSAIEVLAPVVREAVTKAVVKNVSPTATAGEVTVAAQRAIVPKVTEEVAQVIVNQTNQEPWYQSRVTWGAILAALAGILGIFGYALPEEMQGRIVDVIVAAGPLVSALIVLYGRWVAKKPLGQ
jgi:hypothetical protein